MGGDGGVGGAAGTAEVGSFPGSSRFLPSAPLQTRYSSPVAFTSHLKKRVEGLVEVVLLALSLERARQFVKAFGERGGNLHVT